MQHYGSSLCVTASLSNGHPCSSAGAGQHGAEGPPFDQHREGVEGQPQLQAVQTH